MTFLQTTGIILVFIGGAREYIQAPTEVPLCGFWCQIGFQGGVRRTAISRNVEKQQLGLRPWARHAIAVCLFGLGPYKYNKWFFPDFSVFIFFNITAALRYYKWHRIQTNNQKKSKTLRNVSHVFLTVRYFPCCRRFQVQRENVSASEIQLPGGSLQLPRCRQHLGTAPDRARDRLLHWQLLFRRHAVQSR